MLHIFDLHKEAKRRLAAVSVSPKKAALIHTAIALGCSLLLSIITYLLELWIDTTGGLQGIGTRNILISAQTFLTLAVSIALPIWQMGIFYTALKWTKEESVNFSHIAQGFRRFSPAIGIHALRSILFVVLGFAIGRIVLSVFLLTPFATPILELNETIAEQSLTMEELSSLFTSELTSFDMYTVLATMIIFGILYGMVALWVFYRLRFTSFCVMDGMSAGNALLKSLAISYKQVWQLLKLDLSFWWFYLLQMLTVVLCYGTEILAYVGIVLPLPGIVSTSMFYLLGILCQCGLLWQCEAHRVTTYALAYQTLLAPTAQNTGENLA